LKESFNTNINLENIVKSQETTGLFGGWFSVLRKNKIKLKIIFNRPEFLKFSYCYSSKRLFLRRVLSFLRRGDFMLERYRKPGGFANLVKLLETYSEEKRNRLLESVKSEDPFWAELIPQKILTVERIFSWPVPVIAEIFAEVPLRITAMVMKGLNEEQQAVVYNIVGRSRYAELKDLVLTKECKAGEIVSARMFVVNVARELDANNVYKIAVIDPDLSLEDPERGFHKYVLLVDDDPVCLKLLANSLPKMGVGTVEARDGQHALEVLEEEKKKGKNICAVISDINMPRKNGIELLRSFRQKKETRNLPVIVLTGSKDKDHILQASQLEILDYLVKPLDKEVLKKSLKKIGLAS
jgi:CheY-like chemotaxis protein